jgi:hypothetical protein
VFERGHLSSRSRGINIRLRARVEVFRWNIGERCNTGVCVLWFRGLDACF